MRQFAIIVIICGIFLLVDVVLILRRRHRRTEAEVTAEAEAHQARYEELVHRIQQQRAAEAVRERIEAAARYRKEFQVTNK